MAYIHGITPGLVPSIRSEPAAQPVEAVSCADRTCFACGGLLVDKALKSAVEYRDDALVCIHCAKFYGIGTPFPGATNYNPEDTAGKMAKIDDGAEWAMILVDRTFGAAGGVTFTIEKGDFFKIKRHGLVNWGSSLVSYERSGASASVEVHVGPVALTLYPHEFAPYHQTYILSLMAASELEVKYVCQEDEIGYYTPTETIREQIKAWFG